MKAITLHQPWAQLMVTSRAPGAHEVALDVDRGPSASGAHRMVKSIETRSWSAPAGLIGQRIAIHAAARKPDIGRIGDWWTYHDKVIGADRTLSSAFRMHTRADVSEHWVDLPLGAVVGSAVLTACVPMVAGHGRSEDWNDPLLAIDGGTLMLYDELLSNGRDVTDQRPFGVFEPGRWAWIFTDAAPTTERCPACWGANRDPGDGRALTPTRSAGYDKWQVCPVCDGVGRCEPIPARGMQRVWNWAGAAAALPEWRET